jgi:hypothetical protein
MVHFLYFHSYLPFEIGKSDRSKPETTAVPPGRWDNNASATFAPDTTAGAAGSGE